MNETCHEFFLKPLPTELLRINSNRISVLHMSSLSHDPIARGSLMDGL